MLDNTSLQDARNRLPRRTTTREDASGSSRQATATALICIVSRCGSDNSPETRPALYCRLQEGRNRDLADTQTNAATRIRDTCTRRSSGRHRAAAAESRSRTAPVARARHAAEPATPPRTRHAPRRHWTGSSPHVSLVPLASRCRKSAKSRKCGTPLLHISCQTTPQRRKHGIS